MAHLKGMLNISKYTQRSESTIVQWVKDLNFPAKKISQGVWESDTDLIDEWRLEQLKSDVVAPVKEQLKKPVKSTRKKKNK